MKDLEGSIKELYERQSKGSHKSFHEYRSELFGAAAELFRTQPTEVGLSEQSFRVLLVSLLEDHKLPLSEVRQRIYELAKPDRLSHLRS